MGPKWEWTEAALAVNFLWSPWLWLLELLFGRDSRLIPAGNDVEPTIYLPHSSFQEPRNVPMAATNPQPCVAFAKTGMAPPND